MVVNISSRRLSEPAPQSAVRADARPPVKELKEIETKGTPPGIQLLKADDMETWVFLISVLGDETIYRVGGALSRQLSSSPCSRCWLPPGALGALPLAFVYSPPASRHTTSSASS